MGKNGNSDNQNDQGEDIQAASLSSDGSDQVQQDFAELQDKVEELEKRVTEYDNLLKRAVADYQNLEKRVEEGRSELTNWAITELLQSLLPTLDHLETVVEMGRPILSEETRLKDWFRGVELAVSQLKQVLQDAGLEQIAADGQFDPKRHEAVDTEAGEENQILKVTQKGYRLNGKVIRPAKVVVGRKG